MVVGTFDRIVADFVQLPARLPGDSTSLTCAECYQLFTKLVDLLFKLIHSLFLVCTSVVGAS